MTVCLSCPLPQVMLRLCCAAARGGSTALLRGRGGRPQLCHRHASSGGGGGGGVAKVRILSFVAPIDVQVLAGSLFLSAGGAGGVVAYASVDPDFRKQLEDSLPGSDQVLFFCSTF